MPWITFLHRHCRIPFSSINWISIRCAKFLRHFIEWEKKKKKKKRKRNIEKYDISIHWYQFHFHYSFLLHNFVQEIYYNHTMIKLISLFKLWLIVNNYYQKIKIVYHFFSCYLYILVKKLKKLFLFLLLL